MADLIAVTESFFVSSAILNHSFWIFIENLFTTRRTECIINNKRTTGSDVLLHCSIVYQLSVCKCHFNYLESFIIIICSMRWMEIQGEHILIFSSPTIFYSITYLYDGLFTPLYCNISSLAYNYVF